VEPLNPQDMQEVLSPLTLAYAALAIWMIVDAVRRKADFLWYVVILLLPLGAVVYFFLVKLRGTDTLPFSLGSLRPAADAAPDLKQAEAFEESERYDEALELFDAALTEHPADLRALHGAARCWLGKGQPRLAIDHLEKLLEVDRGFRNFSAALDYAEALWQVGRHDECVELVAGLAAYTGRINHSVAEAHYRRLAGDTERTRAVLEAIVARAAQEPDFGRGRDAKWLERAQEMLQELSAAPPATARSTQGGDRGPQRPLDS